jgi:hypothetical protein
MKRRLLISLAVYLGLSVLLSGGRVLAQEGAQRCGTLPPPVAEKRDAILAAAEGGLDDLAALAVSQDFTSNYGGEETLAYWQYLEGEGQDIREISKALLALGCAVEPDDDKVYYSWPAAADLPYGDLTDEERKAIGALHGGDIEDLYVEGPEIGYYAGWSLIITADGRWLALVAGD